MSTGYGAVVNATADSRPLAGEEGIPRGSPPVEERAQGRCCGGHEYHHAEKRKDGQSNKKQSSGEKEIPKDSPPVVNKAQSLCCAGHDHHQAERHKDGQSNKQPLDEKEILKDSPPVMNKAQSGCCTGHDHHHAERRKDDQSNMKQDAIEFLQPSDGYIGRCSAGPDIDSKERCTHSSKPVLSGSVAGTGVEELEAGCCSSKASKPAAETTPEGIKLENGGHANKCCTSNALAKPDPVTSLNGTGDCSKNICCGGKTATHAHKGTLMQARKGSKASYHSAGRATDAHQKPEKDCCKNDCCDMSASSHSEERKCSEDSCCSGSGTTRMCSYTGGVFGIPIWTTTSGAADSMTSSATLDIESGLQPEHLVISVQGMTCVGCEKKLIRSLEMLPSISHIKTSLVLAQAEFDLTQSTSINSNNIIGAIERMTGFSCAKVTQLGSYLDFIMDGDIQAIAAATDMPMGVTDLTIINKATVRVAYRPEAIGARDLLSHSFFQKHKARLGPVAPRLAIASGRSHVRSMFLRTLLSAVLTIPVLVLAWAPLPESKVLYGAISLGFATIVQTVIAGPFYINTIKTLVFSRMVEMDLLIVLSTSVAFLYSIIAYAHLADRKPLPTEQFFETSTLLVTLIMVGRLVGAYARQRAVESISIESLQTPIALLIDPVSHKDREIDVRLLQYQDSFKVLPHTSVVTDGVVTAGETEVDESMVTGEAALVAKRPGLSVVAGSINHDGTLIVHLMRLPHENTIKTIGSLVDEAKSTKPRIQELADRVASIFVPVILVLTALIFVVWVVVCMTARHQSATAASIVAMTYAISSLIISCPCAIGLAVPMVVAIASGVAAKHGLIFKSAETIEVARNVSHVVFDKTGTLTQGRMRVVSESYSAERSDELASIILGLTSHSKHPVALSIAAQMEAAGVRAEAVQHVASVPGNGLEATLKGTRFRAGNPRWLGVEDAPAVQHALSNGQTLFCVVQNDVLVAVFGLRDALRPDAAAVVQELQRRAIDVSIVSGDNEGAVRVVADQLSVAASRVRAGCTPGDKQAYVKELLAAGERRVVMFCGDGTNDAVALAQASIGVNMSDGTDIARGAADVVLVRPLLSNVLVLVDLSRAFYRRVVFNFLWSFVYNVFAILLTAGALPGARITPQYAGLGEIASVLPVIAIAMQLRWFKHRGAKRSHDYAAGENQRSEITRALDAPCRGHLRN